VSVAACRTTAEAPRRARPAAREAAEHLEEAVDEGDRVGQAPGTGSIVIEQPALGGDDRVFRSLVEEDLIERLERALRFAARVLAMIDATERLTHAAVACALWDAGHTGWKTRQEYQRQPNSGKKQLSARPD
jgi:hypothetical protein